MDAPFTDLRMASRDFNELLDSGMRRNDEYCSFRMDTS
jgi:hypothetical protein